MHNNIDNDFYNEYFNLDDDSVGIFYKGNFVGVGKVSESKDFEYGVIWFSKFPEYPELEKMKYKTTIEYKTENCNGKSIPKPYKIIIKECEV